MSKPNLFIVGAPKCGTTSMYYYLKQHPDIYMSDPKELNYFGEDVHGTHMTQSEYLKFFSKAKEAVIGEASTWYLYSSAAADQIYRFNKQAKIVMLLRNPIDAAFSLYLHNVRVGREKYSFKQALDIIFQRKRGEYLPEHVVFPDVFYYLDVYRYTEKIRRYMDIFPHEHVHIIITEDLKNSTQEVYLDVLEFLKLDAYDADFSKRNKAKKVRSKKFLHLYRNKYIHRLFGIFPEDFRSSLGAFIHRLNLGRGKRTMDKKTRVFLKEAFSEDVEDLRRLLKKDLHQWEDF